MKYGVVIGMIVGVASFLLGMSLGVWYITHYVIKPAPLEPYRMAQ